MPKIKGQKRTPYRVWYADLDQKYCRRIDAHSVLDALKRLPKKYQNTVERIVDLGDGQVYKPPFS